MDLKINFWVISAPRLSTGVAPHFEMVVKVFIYYALDDSHFILAPLLGHLGTNYLVPR
jgi:hypothetical protein